MCRLSLSLLVLGGVLLVGCDEAPSALAPLADAADAEVVYREFSVPPSGTFDATYTLEAGGAPAGHRVVFYDIDKNPIVYFRYTPKGTGVRVSAGWPNVDARTATLNLYHHPDDHEPIHSEPVYLGTSTAPARTPTEADLGWAAMSGGSIHKKPGDIRVDNDPRNPRLPADATVCKPPTAEPVLCTAYGLGFDAVVPKVAKIALIGPAGGTLRVHTSTPAEE